MLKETRILLVRHGQSTSNNARLFTGHLNVSLSELGILQAQNTRDYLKDITIDAVYSSDLLRAYDTVSIINEYHNKPIVQNADLREIYGGLWEGIAHSEIEQKYTKDYYIWRNNIGCAVCTGGESVLNVCNRVNKCIRSIAQKNAGKTVLVGMHALAIRSFCAGINGDMAHNIDNLPYPENASVTTVVYENGKFSLIEYGFDKFIKNYNSLESLQSEEMQAYC